MTRYVQQPRKAWMAPVPSMARLRVFLRSMGISLSDDSAGKLALKLAETVKPGDDTAAKAALRTFRLHLRSTGQKLAARHARKALAAYLGTLDWPERLRQMAQAPEPLAFTRSTPVSWFKEDRQTWARFVYRITGKKEGPAVTPESFRHLPSCMRLRFLTRAQPASSGIVRVWGEQQQKGLPPILAGKARQTERQYHQLSRDCAPGSVSGFEFVHYVIVEIPVQSKLDGFEGDFILQRKLRKLHAGMLSGDSLARDVRLLPVAADEVAGYEDLRSVPSGQVQQWPTSSRGWRALIEKCEPFEAVIDLNVGHSCHQGERNIQCSRYGIVRPLPQSSTSSKVKALFGCFSKPAQPSWQAVLSSAPVFETVHSSETGLLVMQNSGNITRYAPWAEDSGFLVHDTNGAASTLVNELAVQAKAEGLGVCLVSHEQNHLEWFEQLAPATISRLDRNSPVSLNPLSGIQTAEELEALIPTLCQIVYELASLQDYSACEELGACLRRAWKLHGESLELAHVANQFRPYGKPAVRALQAALDHVIEQYDAWLAGPCSINLFSQDLCLDISGIAGDWSHPFPLTGMVHRLVISLVYRRAHAFRSRSRGTQLTLLAENYWMDTSPRFCASLIKDCAKSGTCLGLIAQYSLVEFRPLQEAFARNLSTTILVPRLARDSHRAILPPLRPEDFERLPTSREIQDSKGLPFAVVKYHQLQAYFTLNLPDIGPAGK